LGKAKVISYKDIKEVRAKRTARDATKRKGNCGQKRKNTELEASKVELESEVEVEVKVISSRKKVKRGKGPRIRRCRSTAVEVREPEAEPEIQPELQPEPEPQLKPAPWRALVVRMY
jgi:hypothetical protein